MARLEGDDWMHTACKDELGPLGVVLDNWEKLSPNGLFTSAHIWKERMCKHGTHYRTWDPSDFTLRMLIQKWQLKECGQNGGIGSGHDLQAFWQNRTSTDGSSDQVRHYNRLVQSLARRAEVVSTLGELQSLKG